MHLLPSWAPNFHPLIIHFPIVLVLLALLVDGVELVHPLPGFAKLGTALYALAALAAVVALLTGGEASREVFIPGMAHPLVEDHRRWAFVTTFTIIGVAMLRGVVQVVAGQASGRGRRVLFLALTIAVAALVEQTAERGARLVYQQGIGVVAGPGPSRSETPTNLSGTTSRP